MLAIVSVGRDGIARLKGLVVDNRAHELNWLGFSPTDPRVGGAAARARDRQPTGDEAAEMCFPRDRQDVRGGEKAHQHDVDAEKGQDGVAHLRIGQRCLRRRSHGEEICAKQSANRAGGADRGLLGMRVDQDVAAAPPNAEMKNNSKKRTSPMRRARNGAACK